MDDTELLEQLSGVMGKLVDRHLATAKEWFPHELVPWSLGEDFARGESVEGSALPDGVRSALIVNLLTEDNLPYYFNDLDRMYSRDEAWSSWVRRWTAEEGRHSIVIRDYLTVTRLVDPRALERARMAQVGGGVVPHPPSAVDGFAYIALQELATRVSHHNTGKALADQAGYEVMKRVAADENLHHLFYRDLVSASLEVDPSGTLEAIERQVTDFEMPGTGIPDFARHARAIAREGIYNLTVHYESVVVPLVIRAWGLERISGLSARAEQARERVLAHVKRLQRVALRSQERSPRTRGSSAS